MVIEVSRDYKGLIDLAADKDLNFDISNSSITHAKYIIKKIIDRSKEGINIFFKSLTSDIFLEEDIIKSINGNKISVRILLENAKKEEIEKFSELIKNKKLRIRKVRGTVQGLPYFIIGDSKAIRITSKEESNRARVNFNDSSVAKHFDGVFNPIWDSAIKMT